VGVIGLGRTSREEAQPALETKRIRHGTDDAAVGSEHPPDVFDRECRVGQMLQHLTRHDNVERVVGERHFVFGVADEVGAQVGLFVSSKEGKSCRPRGASGIRRRVARAGPRRFGRTAPSSITA
jgi:hypothetical protein